LPPRCRLAATFLFATLLLSSCGDPAPQPKNGESTPAFELSTLDDSSLAFPADLRGHVVALRFWADWCPFCESEMRDVEPIYRTYKDRGLRVLAINVRQDRETAASFIEHLGISYKVLLDEDGAVARTYGVIALPTTFFLDREGRLTTRILGESTPELFERIVNDLL